MAMSILHMFSQYKIKTHFLEDLNTFKTTEKKASFISYLSSSNHMFSLQHWTEALFNIDVAFPVHVILIDVLKCVLSS